jgi:F-type H+-transporting ATPase subunit gamma
MKGFQRKALSSRSFAKGLLELLVKNDSHLSEGPYAIHRDQGSVLFILVTSDKGLCGALNARLVRELFQSEAWNALAPDQRLLLTIGRKSREAAQAQGIAPIKSFEGVREELDVLNALSIIEEIIGFWDRGECREVRLVAPEYVNPFVFHTRMKEYLPLRKGMLESHGLSFSPVAAHEVTIHEPTPERVAEALGAHIVQALFLHAFYELKACEYSSRMVAMKNASDAAGELGRTLTIEYNKARQAKITQELAEISGAVAAMA